MSPDGITGPQWVKRWHFLTSYNVSNSRALSVVHSCSNYKTANKVIFLFWHNTLNTPRPRQNGRHFPDDIFIGIFLNENVWIAIKISMNFVPRGPINNIPALVRIMAWCRPGDKSLSEQMMVSLPMHICVTRPQWIKWIAETWPGGEPTKVKCNYIWANVITFVQK